MMKASYLPPKIILKKLPNNSLTISPNLNYICMWVEKKTKSKMEAMHFPVSLKEAEEQETEPTSFTVSKGKSNIHYTCTFKYLGACIKTQLNENDEVKYSQI